MPGVFKPTVASDRALCWKWTMSLCSPSGPRIPGPSDLLSGLFRNVFPVVLLFPWPVDLVPVVIRRLWVMACLSVSLFVQEMPCYIFLGKATTVPLHFLVESSDLAPCGAPAPARTLGSPITSGLVCVTFRFRFLTC